MGKGQKAVLRFQKSKPFSTGLLISAGLAAFFVAIPLGYIFLSTMEADVADWQRLPGARLGALLSNTLLLVAAVTAGSTLIGVGMAWLTERSDLPGRKMFRWMLAVPLAIPAYIGGIIHLTLMRPHGGVIPKLLQNTTGLAMPEVNLLGFWGAAFVLTIFSYPYIYLLSGAAFRWLNASIEEASRTLGLSPRKTFWGVVLPTLRPGLTAGMILVALDVMAEYGTVALLRYETFTSAIFFQLTGRYDRSMAAMLSGVLVTLAILFLWVEVRTQEQRRFTQLESHWRPARLIHLGRWRYPALLITLGIVSISLLIPLTILIVWSIHALLAPDALATLGRAGTQGYGSYVWNSLWTSGAAAALAVMISLPVAIFALRQPDRMGRFISRFCQIGYAIPGVVIAFSLLFVVNRALPVLYATPMVVVMAYVLRHLPQAVRGSESALIQVSTSLEDAARTLGRTSTGAFFQVTLPLILPGLLAGGALVFLTSLKELPATLLLRPAGFDSLAVRIWIWAVDGFYLQAAPAALLLVLVSAIPLSFLLRKEAMVR